MPAIRKYQPPEDSEPPVVHSRKFAGVWIPASLWLRRDVTWFQKCLISEVASFGECFASNEYLARMMGTTPGVIANELSKLRKMGLILDWGFDGRRRTVTVAREVHPNPFGEPSSGSEGSIHRRVNIDTRKILESKETEETTSVEVASGRRKKHPATWKPNRDSKEEKLSYLKTPQDFPCEDEFDEFLETAELNHIASGKRGDLYHSLCASKWHHWSGRKWIKIGDWRLYVKGLDSKIDRASGL